jgi:hypothetical protein
LKRELRAGFRASQSDAELAGLRDELNLLTSLIVQRLDKMAEIDPPPWGQAVECFNDFKTSKTDEGKQAALARLETIIRSGAVAAQAESVCRAELRELIQEKTRTAAAEWKRIVGLRAFLTAEQAMAFANAVIAAAEKHIPDRAELAAFYDEALGLLGVPKQVEPEMER